MQTQSTIPGKTARRGLPRRLLTDRTYLKDNRDDAPTVSSAKERILSPQEACSEVVLQQDTIIQHVWVDEVTR